MWVAKYRLVCGVVYVVACCYALTSMLLQYKRDRWTVEGTTPSSAPRGMVCHKRTIARYGPPAIISTRPLAPLGRSRNAETIDWPFKAGQSHLESVLGYCSSALYASLLEQIRPSYPPLPF
ncbi:hypothetical protein DENSPDRAFT_600222 [Dentipellis sp. KUC8613]|nr:hypothetical protein DENSPDRAFT_600222 [Dentipellis sp. KUC8613]